MQTRRSFLISSGLAALLAAPAAKAQTAASDLRETLDGPIADLEARSGGRLGVAILESGSGTTYA